MTSVRMSNTRPVIPSALSPGVSVESPDVRNGEYSDVGYSDLMTLAFVAYVTNAGKPGKTHYLQC